MKNENNYQYSDDDTNKLVVPNHGCDHDCDEDGMHEICMNHIDIPFQEVYDDFIDDLNSYFEDDTIDLTSKEVELLRRSLKILEKYRQDMQELEFYRMKFNPVRPLDMEISNLKKGYIGRCRCGQLLVQGKDICCPKCHQFVDWTKEEMI